MSSGTPAPPVTEVDEDLVNEFVGLWDAGAQTDPAVFLEGRGSISVGTLLELVRVDQDARWRANQRVPAESYLERFEPLRADRERTLDLILSEVLLRERLGETLGATEYCNRFPDLADALRRQFTVHQALNRSETGCKGQS